MTDWEVKQKKGSLGSLVQSTMPMALIPAKESAGTVKSDEQARFSAERRHKADHAAGPQPRPSSLAVPSRQESLPSGGSQSPLQVVRMLRDISYSSFDEDTAPSASGATPYPPLQPRQPLMADMVHNTDSSVAGLQEVLKQLDEDANTQKRHSLQLEKRCQLGQPISWEEGAECTQHVWQEKDSREACYLNETQFCQDQKLLHPRRQKVRCSACKVLVHMTCIKQLYYLGISCKSTCREIKQKVKDTTVLHHFLQRRKLAGGKCAKCGRGFGNWRNVSGRTFEGYSCSWCDDAYHCACFNEKFREETCHLGPLRNMIIPPSWIIKLPPQIEQEAESSETKSTSVRRKKTSRRRSKKHLAIEERPSKFFTVKPLASSHSKPVLVFLNPKSGGNQGAKLMQTFQWLLNPRQVFDLTQGGPKFGLQMFRHLSNLRILACGGDGTVGWVLATLDALEFKPYPPVAVLPLGTGNDLSRVLGWGGAYGDEPLENILMHVEDGPVVELDRWVLSVWPNPDIQITDDMEGKDDVPLHVINNYFSIGADAHVTLEFHESREANPQKYSNRFRNKLFYSTLGGLDLLLHKFANLTDHIKLVGDGQDLTPVIRQLRLEAICFLNIPSYGSGTNPWGTPTGREGQRVGQQEMNDGMIEVLGFWASTFPRLYMNAHGERIAQCQHIKLITTASLPVQIDGEACKLKPSVIEVVLQNKAIMIKKAPLRSVNAPLRGVGSTQQLKVSVSKVTEEEYDKLHSDLMEIRKVAKPLGLVVTTPSETLANLRPQINRFTVSDDHHKRKLAQTWQFLDVASSGRLDRVFQILQEQESMMSVGDMLSDGILVVEFETPPSSPYGESTSLDLGSGNRLSKAGETSAPNKLSAGSPNGTLDKKLQFASPIEEPSKNLLTVVADVTGGGASGTDSLSSSPPKSPEPGSSLDDLGYDADNDIVPGLSPLPGADLDSPEDEDTTYLLSASQKEIFDAVKRGNLTKVKDLHINHGAKLAYVDSLGLTPLHHAARLGRKEIVKYIVANIPKDALDLQDEEKAQTALHKAAWYGYRGICKILVDAGTSLTRTDYQGNTPYLKSMESEDTKLQEYLKRKETEQKITTDLDEYRV